MPSFRNTAGKEDYYLGGCEGQVASVGKAEKAMRKSHNKRHDADIVELRC